MSKVLVVEDETGIRSLLVALLQEEGHEVVAAGDGRTALSLAIEQHPDLIVLDMMLPAMTGEDVYQQLRQMNRTEVPVIFMSAASHLRPSPGSNTAFIAKPFDIDHLLAEVERLLKQTPTSSGMC